MKALKILMSNVHASKNESSGDTDDDDDDEIEYVLADRTNLARTNHPHQNKSDAAK